MNPVPEMFTHGVRVQMLIDRGVQNSNKGSKRWMNKLISTNSEEFSRNTEKLLALQEYLSDPDIRLYSSLNQRSMERAIIHFKHKQLDLTSDNIEGFYSRINDSFCSSLMKPENRASSLFLLDCDSKDLAEVNGFMIKHHNIKMHYAYPTPNGWHFIMQPFNIAYCAGLTTFEVKKDALMLLNWLDE